MLVSLDRAKQHIRIVSSHSDDEVVAMIEEASDAVLDYIGRRGNPDEWTEETVPLTVRRAILLELGAADQGRTGDADEPDALSESVRNLLRRWRDPVFA